MAIQYNVATLVREPVGSTRDYDIDSKVLVDEDEPRHERVIGRATLLRTRDGVLVQTELNGVQREHCSRCLSEIEVPVHVKFAEEFFTTVDPETGRLLPRPDDAEAFVIDKQHILDLDEAVRQSWTVAVPMQPLCRPDCQGLCPRCGKDLNEGPCGCAPEPDERWSGLRGLTE